jgi:hypothetical protein
MKVALDFHAIDASGDAAGVFAAVSAHRRGERFGDDGAVASARSSAARADRSQPAVRHESLGGAA